MTIQIFATNTKTQERIEITDLYWFEENFVHDWDGEGWTEKYTFEFYMNGVLVFETK